MGCLVVNNLFSDSTSLYFFSALLQSNAAIISLVGIFVIFKIQTLQSSIDIIKNSLMSDMGRWTTPSMIVELDILPLSNKIDRIEKDPYRNPYINPQVNTWVKKLKEIEKIKAKIKTPTILIVTSLIAFVIGLMFASYIHKLGDISEFIILSLSTSYEIIIVVFVFRTISDLIYLKEENV
jgi:hypothetical protein